MDIKQLGPLFFINGFLQKLDITKDWWILVIMYLIYTFIDEQNCQKILKGIWKWWFPSPEPKPYVSVTFSFEENSKEVRERSDRYIAIMDHIKNLESIKHSIAVPQEKSDIGKDVSIYEVNQDGDILIEQDLEIYANISRKNLQRENEVVTNTQMTIFSYKISHEKLVKWIEHVKEKWELEWRSYLKKNTIYIFDIDWRLSEIRYSDVRNKLTCTMHKFESKSTFENTFFPKKELLIQELEKFKNKPEYYIKTGQPRQFGITLTGPPGYGKTRLIKCIAGHMKRHIVNVTLSDDFPIHKFIDIIYGILPNVSLAPSEFILVLEEIADQTTLVGPREEESFTEEEIKRLKEKHDKELDDNMIKSEKKSILNNRRNFLSRLLPAIDGLAEREGGMIIMSTNHIERLDKALLRPGRSDFHLHMSSGYDRKTIWEILTFNYPSFSKKYTHKKIKDNVIGKYNGSEIIQMIRQMSEKKIEKRFFE